MYSTAPTSSGRRLRPGGRVQAPSSGGSPQRHPGGSAPRCERLRSLPPMTNGQRHGHDAALEDFEVLVPRAIEGSQAAWEALVARLQRVAWRAIAGFDLSPEDRKDAFAAPFFRLNERLTTIREPAKLPGWVATTARNEVRTLLRARRRLRATDPHDLPTLSEAPVDDERLANAELRHAVRDAFATLSERCQELLRLVTVDPPLSYAEIGAVLDMPHGSIGPTRQRCLDALR
jgi:RNA polymerase sigma factor (sigma-70 family)